MKKYVYIEKMYINLDINKYFYSYVKKYKLIYLFFYKW